MTYVKICGVTRPEEAEHAAACGADAIGLIFAPRSPRRVRTEVAAEIGAAAGDHTVRVGVFQDQMEEEIRKTLAAVRLDYLQFHGGETPEFCRRFTTRFYKAFRFGPELDAGSVAAFGETCFLVDGLYAAGSPATGCSPDQLDRIRLICGWGDAVLAGGLAPGNVAALVRAVRPYGVDVSSGVESSPGRKDPDRVKRFLETVREAEVRPGS
jgi:phosphoribosylanthranilate isomerase